jgi:protein TonB
MPELKSEFRIPYPPEAKQKGIQGAVVMDILIDAQGTVRDAKLIEGPGSGLNEAALEAVKKFKFSPAFMQDKPVAVKIRYAYRFILER